MRLIPANVSCTIGQHNAHMQMARNFSTTHTASFSHIAFTNWVTLLAQNVSCLAIKQLHESFQLLSCLIVFLINNETFIQGYYNPYAKQSHISLKLTVPNFQ